MTEETFRFLPSHMKKMVMIFAVVAIALVFTMNVVGAGASDYVTYYTKKDAARFMGVSEDDIVKVVEMDMHDEAVPVFVVKTASGRLQIAFPNVSLSGSYIEMMKDGETVKTKKLKDYWDWRDVKSNNLDDLEYVE